VAQNAACRLFRDDWMVTLAPAQGVLIVSSQGGTAMIKLTVNGRPRTVDVEPEMPLLWVLRDELDVKGPKYGCGIAQCGACTVHLNGEPVRSCSFPVSAAAGKRVVTIEGLAQKGRLHPVQKAWIEHQVPQCGYCQGGQILAAASLLKKNPNPSDRDIDEAMTNICRCGTYARIRQAIHAAAADAGGAKAKKPVKA
jgi:isoquinoline 1-oxidoreductase alpha subunit